MGASKKRCQCEYCGEWFSTTGIARHQTACRLRQASLSQQPSSANQFSKSNQNMLQQLQPILEQINQRLENLERHFNISFNFSPITGGITNVDQFRVILLQIIGQLASSIQVKGNFPLKDIKEQFQINFSLGQSEFEMYILQLYRKQEIDLQPGGDPCEYHLLSPTNKAFYYLIQPAYPAIKSNSSELPPSNNSAQEV